MRKILLLSAFTLTSYLLSANVNFIRVLFNEDASTTATIGWNQKDGDFQALIIDTIPPRTLIKANGEISKDNRFIDNLSSKNHSKGMFNHFIRLKNLQPNTRYYFKILDSEGESNIYYFSTVSDSPNEPLAFIAGGDSRDRSEIRRMGNKMVEKLKPHAVLFNGDFTGFDTEKQWLEWMTDWEVTISEDGRVTPMVVTRGNHELTNKVIVNLFDVPHKKVYYSTTFGGDLLNIVSLNSEILKIFGQKRFLRSTLKKHAEYTWQIPQYHRPIRSHVSHKKEMETEYKNFVPLFEKYPNVRLCLENDSHTCKTTWPIVSSTAPGSEEGFIRNDTIGIVYVGEGCWGAPLRKADDAKCWTRNAEAINQVNWIFVSKEKIEVRTVKYENVDQVESLTEATRFEMPKGIDLWTPSNGAVVTIYPRQ